MAPFHRILVPVDFSNCSHAACEYAVELARKLDASIELLHVDEPPAWQGFVLPELVVSSPNEADTSLRNFVETRTQRALDHLANTLRQRGIQEVRHRREGGKPSDVIVQVAEDERSDLIVMGTHGRKGFERLVMGSVAEQVIRQAPCPVLTVRVPDELAIEPATAAVEEGAAT